jgi:hypothetical protein
MEMGDDWIIQKDLPSELIAGKIKRTEIAERTNPARPRFKKEITS